MAILIDAVNEAAEEAGEEKPVLVEAVEEEDARPEPQPITCTDAATGMAYDILTEAVSAFHREAMCRIDQAVQVADYDTWNIFLYWAWALEKYADIAAGYQQHFDEMLEYTDKRFPDVPRNLHGPMLWNVGRTLMLRTPVYCTYNGGPIEKIGGPVSSIKNAYFYTVRVDRETSFRGRLYRHLGYDEYRQEVELDLIINHARTIGKLARTVTADYTREDDDDWRDFLSDAVEFVLSPITTAISIIFHNELTFALSVTLFALVIVPAMQTATISWGAEASYEMGMIVDYSSGTYMSLNAFAAAVSAEFSAMLTAIHFDTLAAAHEIAYLVSADYRETWSKVQAEVSALSGALGLGPYYLNLLYRNTRTLVLDVSTSMGYKYDMAQVNWLASFSEYSRVLSARAYRYRDNPDLLIYDLEEMVDRSLLDAKGTWMTALVDTVDSALTAVEGAVDTVTTVRNDLERLASGMPEDLGKFVQDRINPIISKVDKFIINDYRPRIEKISAITDVIKERTDRHRENIEGILGRLKYPGDYIGEIDGMTEEERRAQEDKIRDISERSNVRDGEAFASGAIEGLDNWHDFVSSPYGPPQPAAWEVPERAKPYTHKQFELEPGETWYVGDY